MFDDFDFEILSDSNFKEDSVREELIVPLIKALGYSVSGDNRIIRSKSLPHPFISIGSKRYNINIIPDYLFLSEGQPYWILDAKSPTEDITKSKHVEQAYSYAIHPDIRAPLYALCNGKQFALYDIRKNNPIIFFDLKNIELYWDTLNKILNPNIKANSELIEYYPDYGIFLRKMSSSQDELMLILTSVNSCFITKINDNLYTLTTTIESDIKFLASIDLSAEKYFELLNLQDLVLKAEISTALSQFPYYIDTSPKEIQFGFKGVLSNTFNSNKEEDYIPFIVDEIFPYYDFLHKE